MEIFRHELVKADTGRPVLKFVARSQEVAPADPFLEWLHDKKSVRIDWSAFGIEKLKSEPQE